MAEKQTAVIDLPLYDCTESLTKASLVADNQDKSRIQLAVSVLAPACLILRMVTKKIELIAQVKLHCISFESKQVIANHPNHKAILSQSKTIFGEFFFKQLKVTHLTVMTPKKLVKRSG